MRSIIIIYEFQVALFNKKKELEDKIRQYGMYAFLTSSSCIIFTNTSVVNVRDNLMSCINQGDKLYVGETTAPAAWNSLDKEVSDWIIKNLK